jgi:hypothetical protein
MTRQERRARPMTRRRYAAQSRFDEYRRFSDAYDCTFREWLEIRKTQWYRDVKNGVPQRHWWDGKEEAA